MIRWKQSKFVAQIATFVFSALLHEFLFAMMFRSLIPIITVFMLFQIPLIHLTRFMTGKKGGAYLFWVGLILGPSLIFSGYLRVYHETTSFFAKDMIV